MRIRQVKPAFWSDAKMAAVPHDARLFYIGLWMLADDAGWLRWDVSQVAAELYPFEGRKAREKRVERMAADLSGRLVLHECGHAEVPKLAVHQRLAGPTNRVLTVEREHAKCPSPQVPALPRSSPHVPDTVRNGKGTVSEGTSSQGTSGATGLSTLSDVMPGVSFGRKSHAN